MATLTSKINSQSAEFQAKASAMQTLIEDLQWQVSKVITGGGEKYQNKHLARGKLLPRQRIEHLLDLASPFLELSQLAAHGMYGMHIPSAGII
ncbi:MAG: methylcrotonoyl-CoA carboxylase, partial [Gammaproteobacteria bacterium]|nr:methylcrotonoyl-CoA carboxylase [Gammaproteobacteria bacterium]